MTMIDLRVTPELRTRHATYEGARLIRAWRKADPDDPAVRATCELQRETLKQLRNGPVAWSDHITAALAGDGYIAADRLPTLTTRVASGDFKRPKLELERTWHAQLGGADLPSTLAAEPAFWALCHAKWATEGIFGEDLHSAFCGSAADDEAQIRNLFRRTSGLYFRGAVSVINDTRIARGWWRTEIAAEVQRALAAEGASVSHDAVHQRLATGPLWETLSGLAVKRVTSINAPKARAALIAAIMDVGLVTDRKAARAQVRRAVTALGRMAHDFCLHYVPFGPLKGIAHDALGT